MYQLTVWGMTLRQHVDLHPKCVWASQLYNFRFSSSRWSFSPRMEGRITAEMHRSFRQKSVNWMFAVEFIIAGGIPTNRTTFCIRRVPCSSIQVQCRYKAGLWSRSRTQDAKTLLPQSFDTGGQSASRYLIKHLNLNQTYQVSFRQFCYL